MSIATEIERLQNAKANIKTSIENKGVEVGEGTIDTYAEKINQIQAGANFKITNASFLFYEDYRLDILNELCSLISDDCTMHYRMFSGCETLEEIPTLYMGATTHIYQMFTECVNLTTIHGLVDLGKAYSTASNANYTRYTLDVSNAKDLTYESIVNIFDSLYDIKSKGCKVQSLVIGPENMAKVTSEELLTPTNKGWVVS